jgi:pyruvate formate lyase activating enzyme
MQHKFAVKLFSAARAMGVHTALDTNGHLGDRLSDDDLKTIDLVLLDIKSWDEGRHRVLTGHEVGPVLAFARRLAERKRPVWLRYVLVPGLTDHREEIDRIAEFGASLGNIERVDVLPFHQMGAYKWKELGFDYRLKDVSPPAQELIESVCQQFRSAGLVAY